MILLWSFLRAIKNIFIRFKYGLLGISLGFGTVVGKNFKVIGNKVFIGRNVKIGKNVYIQAKEIFIADNVVIGDNFRVEGISSLSIGIYTIIGKNVVVNGLLGASCFIGDLSLVGERSFLNASKSIHIGNGTCIGIDSMIFTHGCWYEYARGFPLNYGEVKIGNNVWLALRVVVHPGVTIGDNSLINSCSLVLKDIPPYSFAYGIPAQFVKDIRTFYNELSQKEKLNIIKKFLIEKLETAGWKYFFKQEKYGDIFFLKKDKKSFWVFFTNDYPLESPPSGEGVVVAQDISNFPEDWQSSLITLYDLETKSYYPKNTKGEEIFMYSLIDYIIRFFPILETKPCK